MSYDSYKNYLHQASKSVKNKKDCDAIFEKESKEWIQDPNMITQDIKSEIKKEEHIDSAEFVIYKRRQLTKNGDPKPKSMCDDSGLPLFIDKDGKYTTKSEGNKIAWGDWVDATKEGVTVNRKVKGDRCRPREIEYRKGWGFYAPPSTEEDVKEAIARDKKVHAYEQEDRANKVQADYKYEKTKDEKKWYDWKCNIWTEKAREYPENWKDVKYKTPKDPTDPTIISFYINNFVGFYQVGANKGEPKFEKEGVGVFKGRQSLEANALNNKVFNIGEMEYQLKRKGFENEKLYTYSTFGGNRELGGEYRYLIPKGNDDVCIADVRAFSGYYDREVEFFYDNGRRGGYNSVAYANFDIGKAIWGKDIKGEKYISKIIKYNGKAPEASVKICHDLFDDVANHSLVKLIPVIPHELELAKIAAEKEEDLEKEASKKVSAVINSN